MLETFVLMELARQLTWSTERARLYHYRTKDKVEVDAVLETPDGRVVAVEVKAGATVRSEDLAGLRHLAQRLDRRFVAGYVLYTGQQTLPFGDRLRAIPIDALWETSHLITPPRHPPSRCRDHRCARGRRYAHVIHRRSPSAHRGGPTPRYQPTPGDTGRTAATRPAR